MAVQIILVITVRPTCYLLLKSSNEWGASETVTMLGSGLLWWEDSGESSQDVLWYEDHAVSVLHSPLNNIQEPGVAVMLEFGDPGLQELCYPFLPPPSTNPLASSLLIDVNTDLLAQSSSNGSFRKHQSHFSIFQ